MANPPVRPWFRLTSIRPVPTPAPAPPPEPRPTFSLPTYRTSSAPSSPQPKPQDKTTQQQHADTPPRKTPHPQAQPSHPQPQDKTTTQQLPNTPSSPPRKAPQAQPQPSHPQPQPQDKATQQRTSTPSSPARKTIPSSSSLPSSPVQNKSHSHSQPPPTSSPEKTIKQPISIPVPVPVRSPVHSPNSKSSITTTAPPPSPLTLPPSHFKPEQQHQPKIPMEPEHKAVLVQKTVVDKPNPHHNNSSVDKPNPHHNNSSSAESHRETRNAHHGKHHFAAKERERETRERKVLDSDDSGNMRVITIAGENRGAYMELVHSPKKHGPKYLHKKGNTKDAESEGSSAEEGNKNKDKNHKGRTSSSFPMTAYMNSNVQCVNNSLLYHASCSHHDPGLHLSLKKKPSAEGYHFKEHVNGHRNT